MGYQEMRKRLDKRYQDRINELMQQKVKIERKMQTQFVRLLSQINAWIVNNNQLSRSSIALHLPSTPITSAPAIKTESNKGVSVKMESTLSHSVPSRMSYENSVDPNNPAILPIVDTRITRVSRAEDTKTFPLMFTERERIEQNVESETIDVHPNTFETVDARIPSSEHWNVANGINGFNSVDTFDAMHTFNEGNICRGESLSLTTDTVTTDTNTKSMGTNMVAMNSRNTLPSDPLSYPMNTIPTSITSSTNTGVQLQPPAELPMELPTPDPSSQVIQPTLETVPSRFTPLQIPRAFDMKNKSSDCPDWITDDGIRSVSSSYTSPQLRFISRIKSRLNADIERSFEVNKSTKWWNRQKWESKLCAVDESWPRKRKDLYDQMNEILAGDITGRPRRSNEDKRGRKRRSTVTVPTQNKKRARRDYKRANQ